MDENLEQLSDKLIDAVVKWVPRSKKPKLIKRARAALDLVDSRARRWKTGKSLRQRLCVAVTGAGEFGRVQAEEELKTFDQINKDLLATNEENGQRREWKNVEKSVKLRRQGAVVEWVPNPWLCLPSATHTTLA